MKTTKQYIFNLFFNYNFKGKDGVNLERGWAEERRDNTLVYIKRLFENKARFSCIARDENEAASFLMLRGYVNLSSPCTPMYVKRLLGKYSSCRPSYFGDMVSLCRFVHVDRNLTVTGRLPCIGGNNIKKLKSFAGDPKFVVKILLDSIDKKDIDKRDETDDKE